MADDYREDDVFEDEEYEEENDRSKLRILLIIIAILLIIFGAVYTGYYMYNQYLAKIEDKQYSTLVTVTESTTQVQKKADNPIDFKSLQKKNDEIYAWLKVPGTKVDYPVVQSKVDDAFYLKHSAIDKSWKASGAVYTESLNTTTFEDRVTVIYGHNGYSDTMFTTLHKFEDGDFFNKHEKFYIYTPGHKLTYEIISAFKYDNRHILNSFFFEEDPVFTEFLTMIQNPTTGVKNVRTFERELNLDDNIVVLSTCIRNQTSKRYLVCGVLISNEETN